MSTLQIPKVLYLYFTRTMTSRKSASCSCMRAMEIRKSAEGDFTRAGRGGKGLRGYFREYFTNAEKQRNRFISDGAPYIRGMLD